MVMPMPLQRAEGVGAVGLPASAGGTGPPVVTLVGRSKDKENQDLQGEYHRISVPVLFHGRPAYRKPGARTVIRYWPPADRWLIDRAGLQETDSCSAYAEQGGSLHPAQEDLVWRVWETAEGQHVPDPQLIATSAPLTVQVVGRTHGEENADLNGEYRLVGLRQGKVAYCKVGQPSHAIRYWPAGDRWLMDLSGLRHVNICNAFAEAHGAAHPAVPGLSWRVWDAALGRHVADAHLAAVAAPAVVEVRGRDGPRENISMNGAYHLFGLHSGRPAYMKADGTGHAIRYWPKEDRWLIDFEGFREVDVCNAYTEAQGLSEHPGDPSLEWNIWESSQGRHIADSSVKAFVAPHWVRISGRQPSKENAAIDGDYVLVGVVEGKAAYQKEHHKSHVIRYRRGEDRWIIDLERGFGGADVANAYADAKGAEHPGNTDLIWHIWEAASQRHVADDEVVAVGHHFAEVDWPQVLRSAGAAKTPTGAPPQPGVAEPAAPASPPQPVPTRLASDCMGASTPAAAPDALGEAAQRGGG